MSSGQLARTGENFPAMNDRGSRRRVRRTSARADRLAEQVLRAYEAGITSAAQYRAELGIEPSFSHGGVAERDGQPYRYATTEADFTGLLGAITHAVGRQSPWERCTLSALTPAQAAERIGRDLFADQARRFALEVMTTGHGFIPLTYRVREPSDVSPTGLWWLSFVDTTKSRPPDEQVPGAGGFLGACVVQADHFMDAITVSHRLGCNPGGQVQGYPTDRPPHPAWMNRLLSATDIDHIDAIEDGLDAAKTAELLGRGLWERR